MQRGRCASRIHMAMRRNAAFCQSGNLDVQDLLWLGLMLVLLAATLAYIRLCDEA
jgi:hypothetical protein